MKKHLPTILTTLLMIVGSALLLYPDISTWRNEAIQTNVIRAYDRHVNYLEQEQIDEHFHRAEEHNTRLSSLCQSLPFIIGYRAYLPEDYSQTLNIDGVMAWIDIPSVDKSLPVFHGSSQDVLSRGVGHIEGTAFPTGGESTHTALTAHSALPDARMFTDLHLMEIGDVFFISVLDRRLAYQVDQIVTIWPHEIEWLRVVPGKDLVTLITCTPHAINTHRLLVRGVRIPYIPEIVEEAAVSFTMANISPRVYMLAGFFLVYLFLLRALQPKKSIVSDEPPVPEDEEIEE